MQTVSMACSLWQWNEKWEKWMLTSVLYWRTRDRLKVLASFSHQDFYYRQQCRRSTQVQQRPNAITHNGLGCQTESVCLDNLDNLTPKGNKDMRAYKSDTFINTKQTSNRKVPPLPLIFTKDYILHCRVQLDHTNRWVMLGFDLQDLGHMKNLCKEKTLPLRILLYFRISICIASMRLPSQSQKSMCINISIFRGLLPQLA